MALEQYRAKRDFRKTPEPAPGPDAGHRRPIFVVQEHHASRLHYDFRLEADGVLKSWAVPKGPSLDPAQKRLAVRVEDHPLSYASFEGNIPEGQYGAGRVIVWDHGTYDHIPRGNPPRTVAGDIEAGRLEFALHGERLRGRFALVRMKGRGKGKENWLLIKMTDEFARPGVGTQAPQGRKTTSARSASDPPPPEVEITHPEKVWFPQAGITKGEVAEYYRRVAPLLLPHLRDRPATLERLPEGLVEGGKRFFQKNTPDTYPAWIPRADFPAEGGKPVRYALVNDLPTLLYLVNQGTVTFHTWFSRVESPDHPDFVLFDLDPSEATLADVVEVAKRLRALLREGGHDPLVKTSGKSGLHVLVAWRQEGGFDAARGWAQEVAGRLVAKLPELATVEIRKAKRGWRVYVDTLQNARGHHAVPPYVVRAVPAASVSWPLSWREVTADLDPSRVNVRTVLLRLGRRRKDPLAGLLPGGR
jgi:DNA ligase D-like protein (predicted polymerase)/DNA ligase D-like protein (predicted 3'-phosphoesterase)